MPQGSRGYIGYKKEVTWGVDPGGAYTGFFPFISENLSPKIPDLLSAAQRGILDEPKSYQGEKQLSGDLLLEVHPVSIGHILRSALGAPAAEVLADSVETVVCACEVNWTSHADVITSLDASDKKKGSYSQKIQVPAGVGDDVILAYEEVTGTPLDASSATHWKFWIKASIATGATDLIFRMTEDNDGGVVGDSDDVNITAMAVPNTWTEVTIAATAGALNAVLTCAIVTGEDLAEIEIKIDDIRMVVAGTATTAYKHIFTPMQTLAQEFNAGAQDSPLWPYTLEIFRDEGLPFSILGAVVNTLNLSFSVTDKIMKAACGMLWKNYEAGTAEGIALEATKPFVWENAKIGIGGTYAGSPNADLESFSITWDNKLVPKYFLNNTAIPGKFVREGFREVTISFVMDFVNRTELDLFLLGTERQFQIILEGADCEAGFPYKLQLDLPKVRYITFPLGITGPGRQSIAVEAKAKYDAAGYVLLTELVNLERTADYAG